MNDARTRDSQSYVFIIYKLNDRVTIEKAREVGTASGLEIQSIQLQTFLGQGMVTVNMADENEEGALPRISNPQKDISSTPSSSTSKKNSI